MSKYNAMHNGSGRISLYSPHLADFSDEEHFQNLHRGRHPSIPSTSKMSRTGSSSSSSGNAPHIKNWINQKSLQRIRDNHTAETLGTRQLYNIVLNNEETFVKGVDDVVKEHEMLCVRRKELLYKQWQEEVYIPLRKSIETEIERGFSPIDRQRRKEHLNYLRYKNRKGDVFLDVVSADEYNPFVINGEFSPVALRAKTAKLKDPLLVSERRKQEEDEFILNCSSGCLGRDRADHMKPARRSLGRENTNSSEWLQMPLRNIESPARRRIRNAPGCFNKSAICFDDWTRTKYGPEVIDSELRIQKKRRFNVPSTMPSRDLLRMISQPIGKASRVRFALPAEAEPIQLTA